MMTKKVVLPLAKMRVLMQIAKPIEETDVTKCLWSQDSVHEFWLVQSLQLLSGEHCLVQSECCLVQSETSHTAVCHRVNLV